MRYGAKIQIETYTSREVEDYEVGTGLNRMTFHYMNGLYNDSFGYVWDGRFVCKNPGRPNVRGWYEAHTVVGKVEQYDGKWQAYSVNRDWIGSYSSKAKAAEACYRDGSLVA